MSASYETMSLAARLSGSRQEQFELDQSLRSSYAGADGDSQAGRERARGQFFQEPIDEQKSCIFGFFKK